MRIGIEFKIDKLPISYHILMVSVVKEAIKFAMKDYYEKIYLLDNSKKNKKTKNFTFAVFLKDYELKGEVFIVKDKVVVTFSSPDYGFMVNLHNGLMGKGFFKYKDIDIRVLRVYMLPEKLIQKDEVIFTTMSALAIRNKEGRFLNIEDDSYMSELNYIANTVIKSYRGYGLKKELIYTPIDLKKVVIKEEIKGFTEITKKKYFYINAYKGSFKLEGDLEDLKLIYQLGLGFRRNEGFGMLDVLE